MITTKLLLAHTDGVHSGIGRKRCGCVLYVRLGAVFTAWASFGTMVDSKP